MSPGGTASPDFPTTGGRVFDERSCLSLGSAGHSDGSWPSSRQRGRSCSRGSSVAPVTTEPRRLKSTLRGPGTWLDEPTMGSPRARVRFSPRSVETSVRGAYGHQDGFVAKLSEDRSIVWSTYFGADDGGFVRDIAADDLGDVYLAAAAVRRPYPHITAGFQRRPNGGDWYWCMSSDVSWSKVGACRASRSWHR